jgi:hypothetical protein
METWQSLDSAQKFFTTNYPEEHENKPPIATIKTNAIALFSIIPRKGLNILQIRDFLKKPHIYQ